MPKWDQIQQALQSNQNQYGEREARNLERRLYDLEATLMSKKLDLDHQKGKNERMQAIADMKSALQGDLLPIQKKYHDAIFSNMTSQKAELTTITGEIEEDTKKLQRGREIDLKLEQMIEEFRQKGEAQLREQKDNLQDLETE